MKNHEWENLSKYMKKCLRCSAIILMNDDDDGITVSQPYLSEDCDVELVKRVLSE